MCNARAACTTPWSMLTGIARASAGLHACVSASGAATAVAVLVPFSEIARGMTALTIEALAVARGEGCAWAGTAMRTGADVDVFACMRSCILMLPQMKCQSVESAAEGSALLWRDVSEPARWQ